MCYLKRLLSADSGAARCFSGDYTRKVAFGRLPLNFVHFCVCCVTFQPLSFDVVCQLEERGRICGGGGGAATDKSKNLLCGSGCVGCGKVAGLFVASLFSPLCRGLQHRHSLGLQFFSVNGCWICQRDLVQSASVDQSWSIRAGLSL